MMINENNLNEILQSCFLFSKGSRIEELERTMDSKNVSIGIKFYIYLEKKGVLG